MDSDSRVQGAVESITRFFGRKSATARAPQLENPVRYPFGEFEFHVTGASGQSIELQISRDFKHWETLESFSLGKERKVISDKKAGNYSALFYRAVSGELQSNYIGFVSFELPPGYSMITNPLRTPDNQISALFPNVPDGSTLNKFSLTTFSLLKNNFEHNRWSSPLDTLSPGEGALFFNPADTPLPARFVGEVSRETHTMPIHSGTSMRASQIPIQGRLDTDLGFPIADGDVVSLYSNHQEKYLEFRYGENGWNGEPPVLRLCEAFWIAKNVSGIWTQKLP